MPIAVFSHGGAPRLGKVFGDSLIELPASDPVFAGSLIDFLDSGERGLNHFWAIGEDFAPKLPLAAVRLHPPIASPEKFLGIGMNYRDHAKEASAAGYADQVYQLWFNKQVSCISGPFDEIVMPSVSDHLDYEVELAVVIGKRCRHISAADAEAVIGGYMVANDVSVRDWQRRSQTMTLGKSFDTHGPTGPWLTLAHEIADPHSLQLRMIVNGEVRQQDHTAHMIHNVFEQIAYLSTVMTLKPGDILATGTPSGVGAAANPPRFLKVGDVLRAEIEGLGFLENRVVADH